MATKNTSAPKSLGRQLNFTTGRMNALCQKLLEPHGLSLPQWVILACLWRDGDQPLSALAEMAGTGLPAMSRIVDRMSERGLVERRQDDADGRVTLIGVTDKGRALDHLADFHEHINDVLCDGFSAQERDLALDLLRRMERNASKALS